MGCGESKHAVAIAEPNKKFTSRSSSRKIENPDEIKPTTTTTTTTTTTAKHENSTAIDGNKKKNGEKIVGVIPGEPFDYQKPTMEAKNATKKGVVVKEEKKKLVVVVAHDRTVSKESQVSDYFSEEGVEEKSEYGSPQHDEDKGSNKAVIVVQEYKTNESGMVEDKEQKHHKQEEMVEIEGRNKQEQVKTEEGVTQTEDNQAVAPQQDVQEISPTQVEQGKSIVVEDKGELLSANDKVVVTKQEAETTAAKETKTVETEEVKPTEVEVGTIAEEKIKNTVN